MTAFWLLRLLVAEVTTVVVVVVLGIGWVGRPLVWVRPSRDDDLLGAGISTLIPLQIIGHILGT
jgi:hypothetical protein